MISGLNSGNIDATTIGSGKTNGAHKRPDPEDLFKKMDADSDGSVSEQEFESTVVSISPQGANAANSADAQSRAETEFKKTDTDGDGKISESELATAVKAREAEHAGEAQGSGAAQGARPAGGGGGGAKTESAAASSSAGKTYDPADTNEDGTVSEQEAIAYAAKQATAQATQTASAAVKSYDEISSLSGGPQASQAAE
jgi:Ca2+-binding EF-hand superfamily protein